MDNRPWEGKLGSLLCRLGEFAKEISIGVSIFTLVALAADRYSGIVYPLARKLQSRSTMVHITVGIIWMSAITFAIPSLVVSEVITAPTSEIQYCSPFGSYGREYSKYVLCKLYTFASHFF